MVKNTKLNDFLNLGIVLAILVLFNVIGGIYFFRIDLTEEKRYTISESGKKILTQLPNDLVVEVYLEGEFPAGFKRLQKAIKEKLDDMKSQSKGRLFYRFIDPSAQTDAKKRTEFYFSLVKKGIQPTNLYANESGNKTEKLIFPGAVIRMANAETSVMLLKGNQMAAPDEILNQSIEGIEYEILNGIKSISSVARKKVAYLRGNNETDSVYIADLVSSLNQQYEVRPVNLKRAANLAGYDAIIVGKPTLPFDEEDKLKIDQFIIDGGKALFFIDPMNINLDSLNSIGAVPIPYNLGLEELFFSYGARINNDLVQDLQSAYIPVNVGTMGDQPQIKMMPWRYFPIVNNFSSHPIVKNSDALYFRFASSIDTVKCPNIKKTVLASSSKYSQKFGGMRQVSFNEIRIEPKPEDFNNSYIPLAVLLEGKFKSPFADRLLFQQKYPGIKLQNKESKVLIVSDGDFFRNEMNPKNGQAMPMGFDPFMKKKFANKDFIMNALTYMVDDVGLINSRLKEITLRPLDKYRIERDKTQIQLYNIVLPLVLIILFGFGKYWWRQRQFGKN